MTDETELRRLVEAHDELFEGMGWDLMPQLMIFNDDKLEIFALVGAHPADMVEALTSAEGPREADAVILMTEVWMVDLEPGVVLTVEPSQHPDRVEVRVLIGVNSAGDVVWLRHPRGKDVRIDTMTVDNSKIRGRIPQALYNHIALRGSHGGH